MGTVNTRSRRLAVVATAVALTLLGAACSSGDDGGGDAATTTTGADTDATTSTTAAGPDDGATRTYDLPGDAVFPEGVAYHSASDRAFVSSSEDGTIFEIDLGTGEVSEFSAAGADGRDNALGMAVDEENGRLWIAGGETPSVFVYDLGSGDLEDGEMIAALPVPDPPEGSVINDVAVTDDGDAYVTNSGAPFVYKVAGSGDSLGDAEVWLDYAGSAIPAEGAILLNGIVARGDQLLTIHSGSGELFRIDQATQEIVVVDTGGEIVGLDGLALDGSTLYGVTPAEVVVSSLSEDLTSAEVQSSITDPTFAFPTTVALLSGDRLLVANSQFDKRDAPVLPFTASDVSSSAG